MLSICFKCFSFFPFKRIIRKWQELWPHIIRRSVCALRFAVPNVRTVQVINYIRCRSGQELAACSCPGNRILPPNMQRYFDVSPLHSCRNWLGVSRISRTNQWLTISDLCFLRDRGEFQAWDCYLYLLTSDLCNWANILNISRLMPKHER